MSDMRPRSPAWMVVSTSPSGELDCKEDAKPPAISSLASSQSERLFGQLQDLEVRIAKIVEEEGRIEDDMAALLACPPPPDASLDTGPDSSGTVPTAPPVEDVLSLPPSATESTQDEDVALDHNFEEQGVSSQSALHLLQQLRSDSNAEFDWTAYLSTLPVADQELFAAEAKVAIPDFDPDTDPDMEGFTCTICSSTLNDPVAVYEHTYCRSCIVQWIQSKQPGQVVRNPNNNTQAITHDDVRPNVTLRNIIELAKQKGERLVAQQRQKFLEIRCTKHYYEQRQRITGEQSQRLSEYMQLWMESGQRRFALLRQRERARQQSAMRRRAEHSAGGQNAAPTSSDCRSDRSEDAQRLRAELLRLNERKRELRRQKVLLQEEANAISEGLSRIHEEQRISQSKRADVERLRGFAIPAGKCEKCGKRSGDLHVSALVRCRRCAATVCVQCCSNIGALVGDVNAVEDEHLELVMVGGRPARLLSWEHICGSCYTVCLRARSQHSDLDKSRHVGFSALELVAARRAEEQSGSVIPTDDGLPFFYVLNPRERSAWRCIREGRSLPAGVVAELARIPDVARSAVDDTITAVMQEYVPAAISAVRSALHQGLEKLGVMRAIEGRGNTSDDFDRV